VIIFIEKNDFFLKTKKRLRNSVFDAVAKIDFVEMGQSYAATITFLLQNHIISSIGYT
jgi:hypothetical protein